jgi:hypothetical protein
MMIYFYFSDGQLCNQLFQYFFIKTHIKKKLVICSNFSELENFIDLRKDKYLIYFNNRLIKLILRRFFFYILKFLSEINVIYSIKTYSKKMLGTSIEYNNIISTKGFVPITFIYPCYFQNEKFFNSKISNILKINKKYNQKALAFINKIPKNFTPVFVHIRTARIKNEINKFIIFGDYNTQLPLNYYKYCIKWFLKNLSNPYFVFVSDNIPYIKNKFSYLKNKIFSTNSIFIDLMIISKCNYGVMSNSSVSWWGGYLNKNKKKIFAPKYWLGWKKRITLQDGGEPKYAILIDPNKFI